MKWEINQRFFSTSIIQNIFFFCIKRLLIIETITTQNKTNHHRLRRATFLLIYLCANQPVTEHRVCWCYICETPSNFVSLSVSTPLSLPLSRLLPPYLLLNTYYLYVMYVCAYVHVLEETQCNMILHKNVGMQNLAAS